MESPITRRFGWLVNMATWTLLNGSLNSIRTQIFRNVMNTPSDGPAGTVIFMWSGSCWNWNQISIWWSWMSKSFLWRVETGNMKPSNSYWGCGTTGNWISYPNFWTSGWYQLSTDMYSIKWLGWRPWFQMSWAKIVQYACVLLMKDGGRLVAITTVVIVLRSGRWQITRVHTVVNYYLRCVECFYNNML